jgi:hypothetical protein
MEDKPDTSAKAADGEQPNKPAKNPRGGFWRWLILHSERKVHQRRARHERKKSEEKPEDKAARRTATATVWIAILTVVLAAVGVLTLIELIEGGADTEALVDASRKQARAADQSAKAAQNFAVSAEGINKGVGGAVEKLNDQATKLGNNVTQASRLASATEKANAGVTAADRPWIGVVIQVTDFDLGKSPTINVAFTNSGKRPARVDLSVWTGGLYLIFPFDPDSKYDLTSVAPSTTIIVPGQTFTMGQTIKGALAQTDFDQMKGEPLQTYFVFAKIEYWDLQTNEFHYTHACVRYIPKAKSATDSGFRNCKEYNEAS